jgi:hypothetical protein
MLIVKARRDMCHIHKHSDRHRKIGQCSLCSLWGDVTNWIMGPSIQIHCNTSATYVRVVKACKLSLAILHANNEYLRFFTLNVYFRHWIRRQMEEQGVL